MVDFSPMRTLSHNACRALSCVALACTLAACGGGMPRLGGGSSASPSHVMELLGSLSYAGQDATLDEGQTAVEAADGRVVVTRTFEITDYLTVPDVLARESKACVALAGALAGDDGEDVAVSWVVGDGHGNVYFALEDSTGTEHTLSGKLDLLPQMGGYVLSDTVYVAIGRSSSGIPPRSGAAPLAADGSEVTAQSWVFIPDEVWVSSL